MGLLSSQLIRSTYSLRIQIRPDLKISKSNIACYKSECSWFLMIDAFDGTSQGNFGIYC